MKKTNLYLAYGSNLNLEQMKYRCPNSKVIGKTELKDYKLVFRGSHGGSVATVEPCKDFKVPVLIWEINDADEKSLDLYEGFPKLYRKKYFDIDFDGKNQKAMVYIMNEGRDINLPSKFYFKTIMDGYKTAKFDLKVLDDALENSRRNTR